MKVVVSEKKMKNKPLAENVWDSDNEWAKMLVSDGPLKCLKCGSKKLGVGLIRHWEWEKEYLVQYHCKMCGGWQETVITEEAVKYGLFAEKKHENA